MDRMESRTTFFRVKTDGPKTRCLAVRRPLDMGKPPGLKLGRYRALVEVFVVLTAALSAWLLFLYTLHGSPTAQYCETRGRVN